MSVALDLGRGDEARVVAVDGERITVHSDRAAAPGSRVEGKALGRTYRFKCHRCVRDGDGFMVEGRFIDLTRGQRQALEAALEAE